MNSVQLIPLKVMTSNKRNLEENKMGNLGQGQIRKGSAEAATRCVL